MRKFYQTAWHGITFDAFSIPSSTTLADEAFYEQFYINFFRRYASADALNPEWVQLKRRIVTHLEKRLLQPLSARILSVGCGLGIMEMNLLEDKYTNLEVTEVSEAPLKWLRQNMRSEHIHVGLFPECVPKQLLYNAILLASVDYFLDDKQLVSSLKSAFEHLHEGGHCTLISHSLDASNSLLRMSHHLKDGLALLLDRLSIRHRGQLWGYQRTPHEYRQVFSMSGFDDIEEELVATQTHWMTYRMTGYKRRPAIERLN